MGYIRAVAGPDRVTPVGKIVGLDGTRSEAEGVTWQQISYDWKLIQAPAGDPRVLSFPETPGDIISFEDGGILWSSPPGPFPPVITMTLVAGSAAVVFSSPIPLAVQKDDFLQVTAGPNLGRYRLIDVDHAGGAVTIESPATASEAITTWRIRDDLSYYINVPHTVGSISVGDTVVVGGRYSFVDGITAPGAQIEINPPLPMALQAVGFLAILPLSMFNLLGGIPSSQFPYASFIPLVQGTYVVRLVVTRMPDVSLEDICAVSAVASNVALGLPIDASWIWQYLSDFWKKVDGKAWVETTWKEAIRTCGALLQELWNVEADASLASAQDVTMSRWLSFSAALEEPDPTKALVERRFRVVYSAELPPVMAPADELRIDVHDAATPTTVTITAAGGEAPGTFSDSMNAALAAAGYDDIKVRVELLDDGTTSTNHFTVRSGTYVVTVYGTYHLGAAGHTNQFRADGVGPWGYLASSTVLRLCADYAGPAAYEAVIDADRVLRPGDAINIGGSNYTITAVGTTRGVAAPGTYPVGFVEFTPPLPSAFFPGNTVYSIPSFFRSPTVNFKDGLVTPGDAAVVFVDHGGIREETEVLVDCAGDFRLGIADPCLFFSGWDVTLKKVMRRYYVPVDPEVLSAPQLKVEPEEQRGWLEFTDYVLSTRWDQRCLVFQFDTETTDGGYTALMRTLPATPWYPPDRYWAEVVYIDRRPELDRRYGINFRLRLEEAPTRPGYSYQKALLGLWYCYLHGSKPHNLEKGMSIMLGAPFFEADGTILADQALAAGKGLLLVQDTEDKEIVRSYIYPTRLGLGVNPDTDVRYVVGDTVHQFEPVSDAAVYRDYLSDPAFIGALIAGGIIQEPQKYHVFHVGVDATALDPHDVAPINAAAEFLLYFRTIYNYPFFALLCRLESLIEIEDQVDFRVSLFLDAYLGSRWGTFSWGRAQLSGSNVHSHHNYILTSDEHFTAMIVAGPPTRIYLYHTNPDGTPNLAAPLDPERWGITARVAGKFLGIFVFERGGVWTEEDIDAVVPGVWPAAGYLEAAGMLPEAGTTISTFAIAGSPPWAFGAAHAYLRNHVRIRLLDGGGVPVPGSDWTVADYPGPDQHSEPLPP